MTLKTIKSRLDKHTKKNAAPSIVVCWCEPGEPCPHHADKTVEWREPKHVRTIGGISLKDI